MAERFVRGRGIGRGTKISDKGSGETQRHVSTGSFPSPRPGPGLRMVQTSTGCQYRMISRGRGRGILSMAAARPARKPGEDGELDQQPTKEDSQCSDIHPLMGNVEKQSSAIDHAAAQLAFRIHRPILLRAIDCTLQVTNFLYSKGVLSEAVRNKLSPDVVGLSKDEKNMILLNEVEDKIKSDPQVFQTFIDALQSEPALEVLATQLLDLYGEYKTTGVPVAPPAHHAGPIARYASYLKAYYNTSTISQDYKWPLTPSTKFINIAVIKKERFTRAEADAFTRATLHGDVDEILEHKEPISIENVLKPDGDKQPRFVLVEGPPGVGKSTFAWELCRRWDDIDTLKHFSLVVLVRLRDVEVQKAKTVADLLYHEDDCLQRAVVQGVRCNEGAGVLLVLDGADEYPAPLRRDHRSLFFQVVSGSCLPRATVLVTSRPSASRELAQETRPHKHVEILGFTKEQIEQYAESVFKSEPDLLTSYKKYISSSPSIKSMLYIPLNNAIVTCVYRENVAKDKPIPTTLTQLYDNLSCILLQRYMLHAKLIESRLDLPDKIEDFPKQIRESLLALAKEAYEGILEQRLVYSRLPEGTTVLGFTTTSPELHTGRQLSHNFLHLTLQEYLAAFYISHLSPVEQLDIFLEYNSQYHLNVMWTFLAGITGFRGIGWKSIISIIVYESNRHTLDPLLVERDDMFLFKCFYEAQCEADFGAFLMDAIRAEPHTRLDYYSLGYCIAHSKCTWRLRMDLGWYHHTEAVAMIETFALGLECQHEIRSHIQCLTLFGSLGEEGVACLRKLPLRRIQGLELRCCELDAAALGVLAHIAPEMCSLKILDISDNQVTSVGTTAILLALVKVKSLQGFSVTIPDCSISVVEALGKLIAPSIGTLMKLHIETSGPHGVERLLNVIFAKSSLQTLYIGCTDLQSSMSTLSALLENNTNLKSLKLYCCKTGGVSGAKCLAASVCKNTTLLGLEIYTSCSDNIQIGDEGAIAFSEMLKVNHSLRILTLSGSGTGISEEGIATLIDSLKYNQTLEKLKLPKDLFDTPTEHPRLEWDDGIYLYTSWSSIR